MESVYLSSSSTDQSAPQIEQRRSSRQSPLAMRTKLDLKPPSTSSRYRQLGVPEQKQPATDTARFRRLRHQSSIVHPTPVLTCNRSPTITRRRSSEARQLAVVLAAMVPRYGLGRHDVSSACERLEQVRIHGELPSNLVPLGLIEPSGDDIPIEYAKPDRARAAAELVVLDRVQDRAAPTLTSLVFLNGELRKPARALMTWPQK